MVLVENGDSGQDKQNQQLGGKLENLPQNRTEKPDNLQVKISRTSEAYNLEDGQGAQTVGQLETIRVGLARTVIGRRD